MDKLQLLKDTLAKKGLLDAIPDRIRSGVLTTITEVLGPKTKLKTGPKPRVAPQDIVTLRDQEKLTWKAISEAVSMSATGCYKSYKKAKQAT